MGKYLDKEGVQRLWNDTKELVEDNLVLKKDEDDNITIKDTDNTLVKCNHVVVLGRENKIGTDDHNCIVENSYILGNGCEVKAPDNVFAVRNVLAVGADVKVKGSAAQGMGYGVQALGDYSHAEGESSIAGGTDSHAEGHFGRAMGSCSHAEGFNTYAEGSSAHAEGTSTEALGDWSHTEGFNTLANNEAEHASGKYNLSNPDTLFSVGNGTENKKRHNTFEIKKDGEILIADTDAEGEDYEKPMLSIQGELNKKANTNGTYPHLTAGIAQNLLGNVEITNDSAYRPTGGDNDVNSGFEAASIESIKGNARAWNQLIDKTTNGFIQTSASSICHAQWQIRSYLSNNNSRLILNHKYYASVTCTTTDKFITSSVQSSNRIVLSNGGDLYGQSFSYTPLTPNQTKTIRAILTNLDSRNRTLFIAYGEGSLNANDTISFKNVMLIDLTLIYGAGNEPSTPEEFEADYQRWFGRTLTYEEYDEGSIRSVKATGIKTVGFNLSSITEYEGTTHDWYLTYGGPNNYLWKNDCGYKGQIYVNVDFSNIVSDIGGKLVNPNIIILYADGGHQYIQDLTDEGGHFSVISIPNRIIDRVIGSYNNIGRFKASNICINFVWSGKRDGEYEPHWEETASIPITTLTSGGKAIFPDGLKRAGDVYDEIFVENGVTKAIKRVGSVDLGTLNWGYNRGDQADVARFWGNLPNTIAGRTKNLLVYKYSYNLYAVENKTIWLTENGMFIQDNDFYNTSVSEAQMASNFKQSLQGVLLYYELATPEEYIIDNFSLPVVYRIDDFGTEQIVQPNNSITPIIDIKYGINAVDTIRRLPARFDEISKVCENHYKELKGLITPTWKGTAAQYEALGTYDNDTIYYILED